MNALGHVPKRGESVVIDKFEFKILRSSNRRIHLLEITSKMNSSDKEATEFTDAEQH